MDKIQVHPTGFIDPQAPSHLSKILAPEVASTNTVLSNEVTCVVDVMHNRACILIFI